MPGASPAQYLQPHTPQNGAIQYSDAHLWPGVLPLLQPCGTAPMASRMQGWWWPWFCCFPKAALAWGFHRPLSWHYLPLQCSKKNTLCWLLFWNHKNVFLQVSASQWQSFDMMKWYLCEIWCYMDTLVRSAPFNLLDVSLLRVLKIIFFSIFSVLLGCKWKRKKNRKKTRNDFFKGM